MKHLPLAMILATALTACGGGGGDNGESLYTPLGGQNQTAEGLYQGTTNNGYEFQTIVLEDGEIWTLYGANSGGVFLISGFLQGQGVSNSLTFASQDYRDFGSSPAIAGTLSGRYVTDVSFNGAMTFPGGIITFTSSAIPSANFNYDTPASISSIVGSWNLSDLRGAPVPITINNRGDVTGAFNGCSFTGAFVPRASGKNVYDVSLQFGATPCPLPGQTARGIALSYQVAGGLTRQLVMVGVDATRTTGAIFLGQR